MPLSMRWLSALSLQLQIRRLFVFIVDIVNYIGCDVRCVIFRVWKVIFFDVLFLGGQDGHKWKDQMHNHPPCHLHNVDG